MSRWGQKSIAAAAVAALLCSAPGFAQMHKVAAKPEQVVRAVGVYEWTGDLSKPTGSRFVPISLFIDGEIEDAGVYQPRPVPFALLTGNVYELEDAGMGRGTLVLEQAMKAQSPEGAPAPAFIDGWTAYGSYKAPPAERKAAPLRASKTLPVIQTSGGDSGRPHLSNKPAADSTKSGAQKQDDSQKPPDVAKSSDTASTGDDSRPTMKRRTDPPTRVDDETDPPKDPNAASSIPKDSDDDRAERPTLRRRSLDEIAQDQKAKKKQNSTASVTAAGSMADDPDRPRLKHNTHSQEDEEAAKLMGVPAGMKQMVAVSDAKTRDQHIFARPWESMDERATTLARMQGFARAKLAEYGVVHGIVPPQAVAATGGTIAIDSPAKTAASAGPPKLRRGIPTDDTTDTASVKPAATAATTAPGDPAAPKLKRGIPTDDTTETAKAPAASATHMASAAQAKTAAAKNAAAKSAAKPAAHGTSAKGRRAAALKAPPPVALADEDLRGYLLSYGGAPTFVYMAHTVEGPDEVPRYVTVVAQADATGQLKVALASVTDAAHLDRTPWMRLVDAVDVEASNRASLLFELRGQSSRQFALYRVIAARPEQIFSTSM